MSRLANSDNTQFRTTLEKTLSLIMFAGIPISLGGIILADQLIPLIFGQDYLGAIPILRVLMLMLLSSFPLVLLSNAIFAYNRQKNLAPAYLLGIFANILFNLLLIPEFGAVGAAIATLASTATITIFIWRKLKRISNFEIIPRLKKSFVATIIMIFFIFTLKYFGVHVVLNIIISSIIYFSVLLLLKESIFKDIKEIVSAKSV